MDLKKGNVYTISKEEKVNRIRKRGKEKHDQASLQQKQLYNQSKNYGERVRYRNFAVQYAAETNRSHRHSVPLLDDEYQVKFFRTFYLFMFYLSQPSESDEETLRPSVSKSVNQTARRSDSAEEHKNHSKFPDKPIRSNLRVGQVQRRRSDNEYDRESKATTKKKTVRYAKVDSSGRTTTLSDNDSGNESFDNRSQRNVRMRTHVSNDDLFTLREEETIGPSRYKKR